MRWLAPVASFTDAWIETMFDRRIQEIEAVASFTDAWIETNKPHNQTTDRLSHLLQMRGLKLVKKYIPVGGIVSHLLQMRGLKLLYSSSA